MKSLGVVCALLLSSLLSPIPVSAQADAAISAIVGGAVTDMVGTDLIKKLKGYSQDLLQDAYNKGNALESKGAQDINNAIVDIELAYQEQLKNTYKTLLPDVRNAMDSLFRIVTTVKEAEGSLWDLTSVLSVDVTEVANQIPFTSKVTYAIKSIKGITQAFVPDYFKISIVGNGIGLPTNDARYESSFFVNGTKVSTSSVQNGATNGSVLITLNASLLDQYFMDDKTSFVDCSFDTDQYLSTYFLWWKTGESKSHYSLPIRIALLPRFPAVMSGTQTVGQQVWGPESKLTTISFSGSQGQFGSKHPLVINGPGYARLPNDKQFTRVVYNHDTGVADRFVYPLGPGGTFYNLAEENHLVNITAKCDSDRSFAFSFDLYVHGLQSVDATVPIPQQRVSYTSPAILDLDPQNSTGNYDLTFTTVGGRVEHVDNTMPQSIDGVVKRIGTAPQGNHIRVTFMISQP